MPGSTHAGGFAATRAQLLREYFEKTRVEECVATCVDTLLKSPELPWNPFPALARLIRHEEMRFALGPFDKTLGLEQSARLRRSESDPRLVHLPDGGACWLDLGPLVDAGVVQRVSGQLASTELLLAFSRAIDTSVGTVHVQAATAIGGSQLFAPRLVRSPSQYELHECFHARGPAGGVGAAIDAFEERARPHPKRRAIAP